MATREHSFDHFVSSGDARLIAALACLALLTPSCSFDIPPEVGLDGEDMPVTVRPDGAVIDLDSARDMLRPDGDASLPDDQGLMDLDAASDLHDLDPDATPDSDATPDMRPDPKALGEPCATDEECAVGRCEAIAGASFCAVACTQGSCEEAGFGCIEGICAPPTFCAPDGPIGPACASCSKCDVSAECTEGRDDQGALTFTCSCPEGFRGDGFTCRDRDECLDLPCDAEATCLNRQGGFECVCNAGFEGDGFVCSPAMSACDACHPQATCLDEGGANERCECDAGYVGNGTVCQDRDECLTAGAAQCASDEVCVNLPGSYRCACAPGYAPGVGGACQDVNECAAGSPPCDPLASCSNTPGSFQCFCPPGVPGNGLNCQPLSSCAEIAQLYPALPSGFYPIVTLSGAALDAYCDMDSDGGVGYTLYRVQSATLAGSQQPYVDTCAAIGLEIVTPRSQEHMDAIMGYNGGEPPNLVNVLPNGPGAKGASAWQGRCSGQSCSFFLNGRENTRCRTVLNLNNGLNRTWSDGTFAESCYAYQEDAGVADDTGLYEIDPDGPSGPRAPFRTFCAMTLDGGGWTLGATTSDDNQDTWTWDDRDLWTSDEQDIGSVSFINRDYKNAAVHDLPITDLAFYHFPSTDWASYHDVAASPGQTVSALLDAAPAPECDPNGGFTMTDGTITATASLCSTNLYLHPGDFDQDNLNFGPLRCSAYRSFGSPRDESAWGFAWSQTRDQPCPFDDPAYSGWGANNWIKDEESDAVGFAEPLGLNTQPGGLGLNYMFLLMRGDKPVEPSGEHGVGERMVLEATASGAAGAACPYGSWEDRGDEVLVQGYVMCGLND